MLTRSRFLRLLAWSGFAAPCLASSPAFAREEGGVPGLAKQERGKSGVPGLAKQERGKGGEPIDIGGRLEPFVDDFLIGELKSASLRLHEPVPSGTAFAFDRPWEGAFSGYVTVLRDGDRHVMYYRGLPTAGADGSIAEVTCCAESRDCVRWEKPDLGLFNVNGTRKNNIVLAGAAPFSHNFAPFLDTRRGVPASERYKALAGTKVSGLVAFVSPDGFRWRKLREKPVLTDGAFDSQNVAFWSEHERCYACYFRTWMDGGFSGYRTVSRATSGDFWAWSKPEAMDFGDTPPEHLYTNQTMPYFRAPHIYLAFPMRFMPGRKVLTAEQAKTLGVNPDYAGDCADGVFMTSRGGNRYHRTFMEGFIRPGADLGNWASRAGMIACGVLPTGHAELSLYKQANYAQPTAHLIRYTLRTDGFVSVNAPYSGGEMITRLLQFTGRELALNISTSAAGSVRVEIRDAAGNPLPGHTLADSEEVVGDMIERPVAWKGGRNLSALEGKPVRLRFVMKDADLYAMKFNQ